MTARLGRYELLELLGEGGMGSVSVACERTPAGIDRLVALKVIHPSATNPERLVRLLMNEAALVGRLAHKNVVKIYRLGEHDGQYFIAMELVEGATLRELIMSTDAHGPLPLAACASAIVQTCRGAHAAHDLTDENGRALELVHRDISPHNVIVDETGVAKLLDFGIATDAAHSATGRSLWGKTSYVSPEQANGIELDRRSDVYALGTVFWELLAGRRRIAHEDERDNIRAIVAGNGPALWPRRPDLPRVLVDIVERALSLRREDRFASAREMADAIEAAARAERIEVSEAALAHVVRERAGDVVTARKVRMLGIESTARSLSTATSATSATSATAATARGDETVVETHAESPAVVGALDATRVVAMPMHAQLPVVASGANYELRRGSDGRVLICRVWARPDLSREEGAQSGKELMMLMLDAFARAELRAVIMDARQAKMVIGGRTLEAIERMFQGAEQRGITIVALISTDPIQKLDFTDVVGRAAPEHGHVSVELTEALRIVGLS